MDTVDRLMDCFMDKIMASMIQSILSVSSSRLVMGRYLAVSVRGMTLAVHS